MNAKNVDPLFVRLKLSKKIDKVCEIELKMMKTNLGNTLV